MPTVFLVDPPAQADGPLYRLFHEAGYYVVQLASGDEALAAMAALRPDVIVADAADAAAGAAALAARLGEEAPSRGLPPLILLNVPPDDRRLRTLVGPDHALADGASHSAHVLHVAERCRARASPPPTFSAPAPPARSTQG